MRKAMIWCLLLASSSLPGCGKEFPMAEVKGRVTYKGQPLPEGTVMFVPQRGFAAAGAIRSDGEFQLLSGKPGSGAVIGHHKVAVIPPFQPQSPNYPRFPLKYQDAETSGFVAEVKEGVNVFEFDLATN